MRGMTLVLGGWGLVVSLIFLALLSPFFSLSSQTTSLMVLQFFATNGDVIDSCSLSPVYRSTRGRGVVPSRLLTDLSRRLE
jgi:hypothetical protein